MHDSGCITQLKRQT